MIKFQIVAVAWMVTLSRYHHYNVKPLVWRFLRKVQQVRYRSLHESST
ncbi:hypothetical protein [Ciceribacter ferrooxidans]|nr:hypothetical protein [Ciceribacter ferrooxidans]